MQIPITTIIVNFNTPDLTERAINSFRRFYPNISLVIVDNGSTDNSVEVFNHLRHQHPYETEIDVHPRNLHHGPAMDIAIRKAKTSNIIFLDSDCEVKTGGFIEAMFSSLDSGPTNYAVGKKIFMNRRGFDVDDEEHGMPYIRPFCMMLRRNIYLLLPKFKHHGAPCLDNMRKAVEWGYQLIDFPVEEFIKHEGRGTAKQFGYNLGWQGKLNHLLHKMRM